MVLQQVQGREGEATHAAEACAFNFYNCTNRIQSKGDKNTEVNKKEKPIANVFRQLITKMESDNPVQFRLPQEIRQFFVGVGTGQRGEYVDEKGARMKYE